VSPHPRDPAKLFAAELSPALGQDPYVPFPSRGGLGWGWVIDTESIAAKFQSHPGRARKNKVFPNPE
jgi:hypothetical protein